MMLAVDVDYRKTEAMVAGVCFADWEDESPLHIVKSKVGDIEAYEPGFFYKRELPCIIKLIEEHALTPELIIVDGYVVLGSEAKSGLGMYLYNALQCKIPIVGVAKRRFKDTAHTAEVLRGQSKNPLYVTAIGVDEQVVKTAIKGHARRAQDANTVKAGGFRMQEKLVLILKQSRSEGIRYLPAVRY